MNKLIPLLSKEDASRQGCPFKFPNSNWTDFDCDPDTCMAWTVVYPKDCREDHSGAKERIHNWARGLGVEPYKEGPGGSMGYWCIPETGYCKRLWPVEKNVSAGDYIK